MKTILFLWVFAVLCAWILSAMKHFVGDAWWVFPLYITFVACFGAGAICYLVRETPNE